jgi:DNA-binding transcriptional MocR family regulator
MTSPTQNAALADAPTRAEASTLTLQLAERFAQRIAQRQLAPGARLPSVRECAARHGVSPSTVVGAYDLLQARGLVQARPQRGFFVREGAAVAPLPQRGAGAARPLPLNATALIRGMFQAQGEHPAPGLGMLPEDWLDAALLQRALRRVCMRPSPWLRYGDPAGEPALRGGMGGRLGTWACPPMPRRSSPPRARRRRWTSSRERCCSRVTRCLSTNPAGRSNMRGWRGWA